MYQLPALAGAADLQLQLPQLRPARVGLALVRVLRVEVEVLAALGAEAGAVGSADELRRQGQRERVVGPLGDVDDLVGVDVRAVQLLFLVPGWSTSRASTLKLVDDASRQRMQAPTSAASKRSRSAQPLPVVRETSSLTGITAGSTAYVWPLRSNSPTGTSRSIERPSPEVRRSAARS